DRLLTSSLGDETCENSRAEGPSSTPDCRCAPRCFCPAAKQPGGHPFDSPARRPRREEILEVTFSRVSLAVVLCSAQPSANRYHILEQRRSGHRRIWGGANEWF